MQKKINKRGCVGLKAPDPASGIIPIAEKLHEKRIYFTFQMMKPLFIIIQMLCCIPLAGQTIHGLVVNPDKKQSPMPMWCW